jgi:hypothetical protein
MHHSVITKLQYTFPNFLKAYLRLNVVAEPACCPVATVTLGIKTARHSGEETKDVHLVYVASLDPPDLNPNCSKQGRRTIHLMADYKRSGRSAAHSVQNRDRSESFYI